MIKFVEFRYAQFGFLAKRSFKFL